MARVSPQLPLGSDGACMMCKATPPEEATLTCTTCATPWHVDCLSVLPETMTSAMTFECPDCSGDGLEGAPAPLDLEKKDLFAKIREIEADGTLSEKEKAKRRQAVLGGKIDGDDGDGSDDGKGDGEIDVLAVLGESFKCSCCMELPERPVTTPCGHNFCLKCFQKWIRQGKNTCVKCRCKIPEKMASQPRINSTLVSAIRMAKLSRSTSTGAAQTIFRFAHNQDRPDKAFTTTRARKAGMANAASGRVFVTCPNDHFGPIPAECDPIRNQGVLVGESWTLRLDVRQWGLHYPPVAGIAGQSNYGAQSVVISGGYEDDEDNGEWFIYTGSGGRDLSGNKRTNKAQSFDQEFKGPNQALRISCEKGYPVRVVRSEKDKRSSYAPEKGYRYDGVYRIERCWRKAGIQGFKVCRYLFVRCDNEPAPWTSDEHGDRPRELPVIPEFENAVNVSERKESPSWDYDETASSWKWKKPPPRSEANVVQVNPEELKNAGKVIRKAQTISIKEKMLQEFCCLICNKVMDLPVTTPCGHHFCKACLENKFVGQTFAKERICPNGRKLRAQKNVRKCPACPTDISEFLESPQVNREMMEVIQRFQSDLERERKDSDREEAIPDMEIHDDALPVVKEEGVSSHHDEDGETNHEECHDSSPSDKEIDGQAEENPLKRKNISVDEEISKKQKVDAGDGSEPEKAADSDDNVSSEAPVVKRSRGRPRK